MKNMRCYSALGNIHYANFGVWVGCGLGVGLGKFWTKTGMFRVYFGTLKTNSAKKLPEGLITQDMYQICARL